MREHSWRARLRREVAWLLLLKFAALALLWWLFFAPAHREHLDSAHAARQLAVPAAVPERR